MSPRTRSSSQCLNDLCKDATTQTERYKRSASTTSNAESSAQAAARAATSKSQSRSSITKKTYPRNLSKKVIGISQSEQDPASRILAAATATAAKNKSRQKPDNCNDKDNREEHEQENIEQGPGKNQQEQSTDKPNNFCFKGEGKFYLNFPFPVFSEATSNISLLCGNKGNSSSPMSPKTKHSPHNKMCDLVNNSPNNLRNDFSHILGNIKDMIKAVKTVAGKTESHRKRGYSVERDDCEQQQNEDEHASKRLCRRQSEASEDDSLFADISFRVLELQDLIKKGEEQLNVLHNQYGCLGKLYHEAFGVIHCNNGIARDAAVIQFSHKASTIASSAFNLWHTLDKLDKNAKQLVDIFMSESFEGEEGG